MNLAAYASILLKGGLIAYPTEAVFGIGCDPFNEQAVQRLLTLKNRAQDCGLILVAANWQSVADLIAPLPQSILDRAFNTWPGPHTWLFPAAIKVPEWIRGTHPTIALRLSNHPTILDLCQAFGGPIVSTSANIHGQPAAKTTQEVTQLLGQQLDAIISGNTQGHKNPSRITDIISNEIIR